MRRFDTPPQCSNIIFLQYILFEVDEVDEIRVDKEGDERENMDRMNDENGCERMLKTLYRLCSQSIMIKKTNKNYKRKTII